MEEMEKENATYHIGLGPLALGAFLVLGLRVSVIVNFLARALQKFFFLFNFF